MSLLNFLTNKWFSFGWILRNVWAVYFLCAYPGEGGATSYFINSLVGNDENIGTSMELPWKSLVNLGRDIFQPGDSILFAKGSSYKGGVIFSCSGTNDNPITISHYSTPPDIIMKNPRKDLSPLLKKYGAGRLPAFSNPKWEFLNGNIFRIEGNCIVIDGLYFHDNANPPGSNKKSKNVQKMGAIYLALGTHHNIVKNCEFENTPVAVKVKGTHNLITRNYFHDTYEPMAESWGPIAIMIVSAHNEISYNHIANYGSYGGPYGSDGGVIELDGVDDDFDAHHIHIHHNISVNNHGFIEIAARDVDHVRVAYNLSDDRNQFIGGGSMKVEVFNNTIIRTREPNIDRFVFWTFDPEKTFLNIRNNIFYVASDVQVLGPVKEQIGHMRVAIGNQKRSRNIYYSPGNTDPVGIPHQKDDWVIDPLFVDINNRNFRLKKSSPARKRGFSFGYTHDLDMYPVAIKGKIDLGAYMFE
jgi:hypothetical protein